MCRSFFFTKGGDIFLKRERNPGFNLEIMGRVRKIVKRVTVRENILKTQLNINKSQKRGTFFFLKTRNAAFDIRTIN